MRKVGKITRLPIVRSAFLQQFAALGAKFMCLVILKDVLVASKCARRQSHFPPTQFIPSFVLPHSSAPPVTQC